jgi:ABC-type multidrug transport system, ATPase and permease components
MKRKSENKYSILSNILYTFKKIWKWDYKYFITYLPLQPLLVATSVFAIYIPKLIIDSIENKQGISKIALLIIVLFSISLLIELSSKFCRHKMVSKFYVFSKMFDMELSEKEMTTDYANTDNPEIQNKFWRASDNLWATDFLFSYLSILIKNILGVFTYGAIIITLSPIILVILVFSSVITYYMGKKQIRHIDNYKDETATRDRKKWYVITRAEQFEYAKEVKLYGMTDWINSLLNKFKSETLKWEKSLTTRAFIMNLITSLLALLRDGAAYFILIYMFFNNKISVGDFTLYFGAITGFAIWLNDIAKSLNNVVRQSIAVGYFREYIDTEDVYNHGKGCELPKKEDLPLEIEFKNVSYKYPKAENYTVKNINLKINKGEKLAIVGENGAGKTTLIKLLCGYYYPTEGEILVNGKLISEYNIEEYYTMFAAVFQDIGLLPISIEEFISCGNVDSEKIKKVIQQAELADKIASLENGTKTMLMKSVYDDAIDLSGGETQKMMLARALYKDAPFIILDEPTSALDPIAESDLYQKYNELTHDKTSVYISHRLASTRFCDRILYIENGEIAEQGSHYELMSQQSKYANMFDLQSHYYKEVSINET